VPLYAQNDTWGSFLRVLPARVLAEDAGINTSLYILKQTHEPLFRIDDGENYTSRLLTRWQRSIDSSSYVFCPDTSLSFVNGEKFSLQFFTTYISKVSGAFSAGRDISSDGNCVKVRFDRGRKDFLKYLAQYEQSPAVKINERVEAGLGPFDVATISESEIRLNRKKPVNRGYNAILIHRYSGKEAADAPNRGISDFNKIPEAEVPEFVKKEYLHFDAVTLKTIVLVINWPEKSIRDVLYNCIDIDTFRRVYYPAQNEFVSISGVLPAGVPGAIAGRPAQKCVIPADFKKPGVPLVFVNLSSTNDTGLGLFFADLYARTGIKVSVEKIKDKDIMRDLFKFPRKYNLSVVAMDAVRPDHSAFFDYLVKKDGFFDVQMPELSKVYQKLLDSGDSSQTAALGRELSILVEAEHIALPLLQVQRRFYYPRKIKNLMAGRGFLEYPEIADFRW